jgi:hypothetical protein
MKNILVRNRVSGKFGHANTYSSVKGYSWIVVVLLQEPENEHTCNEPSFHWTWEVVDDCG